VNTRSGQRRTGGLTCPADANPGGGLVEKNLEYRARAAECAARAKEATDARIKAFNQAEAEAWLRLAEIVEKPGGSGTT
jgi:hypothetical protein